MQEFITVLSQKDLSSEFYSRLNEGISLYHENPSRILVINSEASISPTVLEYLDDMHVDMATVIFQSRSKDTIGEAVYLRKLLPPCPAKIKVVSSDYHIKYRAQLIFNFILGAAYSLSYNMVPTDKIDDPVSIGEQLSSLRSFLELIEAVNYNDIGSMEQVLLHEHDLYRAVK